jgi:hypothetical protein
LAHRVAATGKDTLKSKPWIPAHKIAGMTDQEKGKSWVLAKRLREGEAERESGIAASGGGDGQGQLPCVRYAERNDALVARDGAAIALLLT